MVIGLQRFAVSVSANTQAKYKGNLLDLFIAHFVVFSCGSWLKNGVVVLLLGFERIADPRRNDFRRSRNGIDIK